MLYTRPVPLTGFTTDPKLMEQLDLMPSRYQGPTGIIGVLADASRKAAVPHASLWASLPHYLAVSPNPRGTLALLSAVAQPPVDTSPLERAAADFQAKINEAVNADPKLSAFIRELKRANSNSEALGSGSRLQRGAHPRRSCAASATSRYPKK